MYSPTWRPSITRSAHILHWAGCLQPSLKQTSCHLALHERASRRISKIHSTFFGNFVSVFPGRAHFLQRTLQLESISSIQKRFLYSLIIFFNSISEFSRRYESITPNTCQDVMENLMKRRMIYRKSYGYVVLNCIESQKNVSAEKIRLYRSRRQKEIYAFCTMIKSQAL